MHQLVQHFKQAQQALLRVMDLEHVHDAFECLITSVHRVGAPKNINDFCSRCIFSDRTETSVRTCALRRRMAKCMTWRACSKCLSLRWHSCRNACHEKLGPTLLRTISIGIVKGVPESANFELRDELRPNCSAAAVSDLAITGAKRAHGMRGRTDNVRMMCA